MLRIISGILGIAIFLTIVPVFLCADSIVLGPSDFVSYLDSATYRRSPSSLYITNGSADRLFYAPVHLPEGARMTSIVVFYKDVSENGNIRISLWKRNIYTSYLSEMVQWTSSDDTTDTPLIHKIYPITGGSTIKNSGYLYHVGVFFLDNTADAACAVFAVKINYEL